MKFEIHLTLKFMNGNGVMRLSQTNSIKSLFELYESEILYVAYIAPLAVMFVSNSIFLAHDMFAYVTSPLYLYIILNKLYVRRAQKLTLTYSNANDARSFFTITILSSAIFIASIIYIFELSLMTILLPSFDAGWIKVMLYFDFPLILFLLITSYLLSHTIWFSDYLYAHLSMMAAVVALINICVYIRSLDNLESFQLVRMKSTYGHVIDHSENASGVLYGLFFVASFTQFFRLKSNFFKLCMITSTIILLSATILTQSRSALVASAVSLFVFLIIADAKYKKFVVVFISAILVSYFSLKTISGSALGRGNSYRFELWNKYIDIIKNNVFFGYGERTNFSVPFSDSDVAPHAHNMVLNSMLDGGLFAACSIIFIFFYSVKCALDYNKKAQNPLPLIMILIPLVAGLVDFKLEILTAGWHWIVFWLPVGLCIGAEISTKLQHAMPKSSTVPSFH